MARFFIFLFSVFILISLYQDLVHGTSLNNKSIQQSIKSIKHNKDFTAQRVKVGQGDTVLSIIEQINGPNLLIMNIDQFFLDFKEMNTNVNPYELKAGAYYYFPIYNTQT